MHAQALAALSGRFGERITVAIPSSTAVEWAQADHSNVPCLSAPGVAVRLVFARLVRVEKELS